MPSAPTPPTSSSAPTPSTPPPAPASPPPAASPRPTSARIVEIRLSLSTFALRTLSEPRLRRLIEIETEDVAVLAPGPSGPLGDHVAYVWVDHPSISRVVVEVRVGDHAVERREIAVRGLAGDVVARLVAIAISEMVRAGMVPRPVPPPPPPPPRKPTADELERAARSAFAVTLSPDASVVGLPAASGVLGGAGISLAFRGYGASEWLFGRWLAGAVHGSEARWLELGLGADYRFWLGKSWRLALGGSAAFSSVHLADAKSVGGEVDQRETWSARAGGFVAVEAKVASSIWLALQVEPGAILRPVRFTGSTGAESVMQGAWLGAGLGVRFEKVRTPPSTP
ncbi:Hypothetical protein A7982_11066 [Minicystis rosea]|nr:Hypothetical protein A7982_11066 [Minicystis rosea]